MGDVFLPLLLFSLVGSDKSRCRNKSSALLKSTETLVGILFNGIECFNLTVRQYSFQKEREKICVEYFWDGFTLCDKFPCCYHFKNPRKRGIPEFRSNSFLAERRMSRASATLKSYTPSVLTPSLTNKTTVV